MLIGIILGSILGIILLLIGFVGIIVNKQKRRSSHWPDWVVIAGGYAILTAIFNIMRLH
ncbi:hypothetical protein CcarbDRAFT_1660 [Clostridium carboxidivorans P7]|uniref:Uncharacterized protein n=1 Tax=Clostridium carboxidivorans P7 TaxID=536227 RepID=C6PS93_9CLOT|nr:hypothetical protein [Clostridium carboxidivorans]EET87890.1 hypothetical protein CcarbDRAFT_1660 [Clostridium carboxidivorans P7]